MFNAKKTVYDTSCLPRGNAGVGQQYDPIHPALPDPERLSELRRRIGPRGGVLRRRLGRDVGKLSGADLLVHAGCRLVLRPVLQQQSLPLRLMRRALLVLALATPLY